MTSLDHDDSDDARFERLLLDSAQTDALPNDVDAAWQQFSTALNGVSLLAAGAAGALAVRRAQRWLAVKWLLAGVVTGGALTALSLRPTHERRPQTIATVSARLSASAAASNTPTAPGEVEAQRPEPPQTTPKLLPRSIRPRPSPSHVEATPSASSTLSAQVAMLDAARTAVAHGAFAEALRLSDRYHVDFPDGALSPEAEVVAIEALVERGERTPALERAARFFARYPGDPHSARVKWLVR